jgi:large subunit ribosomal protein L13
MTETAFLTPAATAARGQWYVIDATDQVLGRMACQLASLLRGKLDPMFTPHTGTANHIVIVNAERVRVTGNKAEKKIYQRYSGYPSGRKQRTFQKQAALRPTDIIRKAVRGMLPKTKQGDQLITHLHVHTGAEHPHVAQHPQPITVTRIGIEGLT